LFEGDEEVLDHPSYSGDGLIGVVLAEVRRGGRRRWGAS
jgi:hypothetical protein